MKQKLDFEEKNSQVLEEQELDERLTEMTLKERMLGGKRE